MSHPIKEFRVRGQVPNISMERLRADGRSTGTARPASAEELEMYLMIRQQADRIDQLRDEVMMATRSAIEAREQATKLAQELGELKAESGEYHG